jgi:hypothetical protein
MKTQSFFLRPNDPNRNNITRNVHVFIDKLPLDKSWVIEISREVKTWSDKQRHALFGVAYKAIMDYMGLRGGKDRDELHIYMCGAYFGWRETSPLMRAVPVRTTTKNELGEDDEIDSETACDMYAFIQQRAAEQGIFVPDPDPCWNLKR